MSHEPAAAGRGAGRVGQATRGSAAVAGRAVTEAARGAALAGLVGWLVGAGAVRRRGKVTCKIAYAKQCRGMEVWAVLSADVQ